jgi:rifampicin phosphotransferase
MSKAIYLKYLQDSGYNVPPFVVINQNENLDLFVSHLPEDKKFAVRSSANLEDSTTDSFAGIFDTYLNIPPKLLYEYIPNVFNLLNNDRLKIYLNHCHMNIELLHMEVILQEMINCEKAGVAFSRNPLSGVSEIYIEAVWGLGEQCVSGKSSCDIIKANSNQIFSYEVGFQNKMAVCDYHCGIVLQDIELIKQSKRKLSEKEVFSITEVMKKLSTDISYGFEIEWGIADGCLYLIQLRPITKKK